MRTSVLLLSLFGAAIAGDGFVKLALEREAAPLLRRRQVNTDNLDQQIVANDKRNLYWLNLTIGSPAQSFKVYRLQIDTGSSDLVVPSKNDEECSAKGGCPSGSFDTSSSSTYEVVVQGGFNDSYGDGTAYIGDWATDVINVGGIEIKKGDLVFGLATELENGPQVPNDGSGLVGIGAQALSGYAAYTINNGSLPPTLVSSMVTAGDINRQAYSLFLGSESSGQGSIVFGGVEPSYYTGDLIAMPMIETPNPLSNYTRSQVALTAVNVTDLDGTRSMTSSDFAIAVLLDSGTTSSYLPSDIVQNIYQGIGATVISGLAVVPCSRAQANVTLTIELGGAGGALISIPVSALIQTFPGEAFTFQDGEDVCSFELMPANDNGPILGDSFLRSGYFVYDLENNIVAAAQAATSPSKGSVTAIPTGSEIPGCSSTVTFTLPEQTASVSSEDIGGAATSVAPTGSFLPGTATFDIGSVSTITTNPTSTGASGSSGSSGSSSSSSGAAMPAATFMAGLEKVGMVVAAAMVGGVAVL